MKSFDHELQKLAKKTRLKAKERAEVRERILQYMEYHPLPKSTERTETAIPAEPYVRLSFNTLYTRVAAGVLGVLILVGVPIAAERAVPGDVLYPVKTGINEAVRSQFVNSPYEKVVFETELMERRISEARLLAREGRLTSEVGAQIAENVETHANAVQQSISELKRTDAEEGALAEITYGSALDVQSAVLGTDSATSVESIATAVNEARENAHAQKSTTTPSYERLSARVEQETTRALELFATIEDVATEEERTSIERRIGDIERKVTQAQTLREEDRAGASRQLADALAVVQKLISFMTDIDVRENVDLDTLVPVELTEEERLAAAAELLTGASRTLDLIELRLEKIEEPALREKVEVGIADAKTLFGVATTSRAEGKMEQYERVVRQFGALVGDLDTITSDIAVEFPDVQRGASTGERATTSPAQGTSTPTTTDESSGTSTTDTTERTKENTAEQSDETDDDVATGTPEDS